VPPGRHPPSRFRRGAYAQGQGNDSEYGVRIIVAGKQVYSCSSLRVKFALAALRVKEVAARILAN